MGIKEGQPEATEDVVVSYPEAPLHFACGKGIVSGSAVCEALIRIHNHTPYTIELLWVDYKGKTQDYGRLNAGQSVRMSTFLTHPWVFRAVDNPTASPFLVIRGQKKQVAFPSLQNPDIHIEMAKPIVWSPKTHNTHYKNHVLFRKRVRTLLAVFHQLQKQHGQPVRMLSALSSSSSGNWDASLQRSSTAQRSPVKYGAGYYPYASSPGGNQQQAAASGYAADLLAKQAQHHAKSPAGPASPNTMRKRGIAGSIRAFCSLPVTSAQVPAVVFDDMEEDEFRGELAADYGTAGRALSFARPATYPGWVIPAELPVIMMQTASSGAWGHDSSSCNCCVAPHIGDIPHDVVLDIIRELAPPVPDVLLSTVDDCELPPEHLLNLHNTQAALVQAQVAQGLYPPPANGQQQAPAVGPQQAGAPAAAGAQNQAAPAADAAQAAPVAPVQA